MKINLLIFYNIRNLFFLLNYAFYNDIPKFGSALGSEN